MDGFPRISRPCPVADRLDEVMDGDFCRQCSKRVVDLDELGTAARLRTLAEAREELCVSYKHPAAKALIAATALAAGIMAMPAAAQDAPTAQAAPANAAAMDEEIVVGGAPILTPAQRAHYKREARRIERQEKAAARRTEREKKQAEGPAG